MNEAKEEYISITSHAEMMEDRLKESQEALAEANENVADLRALLDNTNACLEEKTKATDVLEEKLNQQSCAMLEAEQRSRRTQAEMEKTIRELMEKIESLEKSSSPKNNNNSSPAMPQIEIKKEIMSESESDLSTDFPKTAIPDGIVIKTDTYEILTIPSSAYRSDRESEMLREVALEENVDGMVEKLVEMQNKLDEKEVENKSLKKKLAQSLEETQSLKESLYSTKQQLITITADIEELKKAQNLESQARARDVSLAEKALEPCVSLKDCDSQTNAISMTEGGNQTDAVVDLNKSMQTSFLASSDEEKSVQTSFGENEESRIVTDNLMSQLKTKCSQLETECEKKQLVRLSFFFF